MKIIKTSSKSILRSVLKFIIRVIFSIRHRMSNPFGIYYNFKEKIDYCLFNRTPTLLEKNISKIRGGLHIANFNNYNGGDLLLTVVIRDLFDKNLGYHHWKKKHVHEKINSNDINKSNLLLIGGGGLIINDTNNKSKSGWQWDCSITTLSNINVPVVVFAIGYNMFRGENYFKQNFKKNINTLVKNSLFFGLRNQGSINSLKKVIDKSLHYKLSFQP